MGAEGRADALQMEEGDELALANDGQMTTQSESKRGRRLSFRRTLGTLLIVAGHRTTYLAPFAHIDRLRAGDAVFIETPYASFEYRITRHVIVPADALYV